MKTVRCTLVSVLLSFQLLAQISPPVPPRIGDPIDYYKFKDTNWTSAHGFAPRSFSGIEGVTGWGTNLAMRIAGTAPAWLQYNYIDTNTNGSQTNLTFPEGALTFWVRPLWSGTNIDGGTGPGVPARLIELGAFTEQGNWGWFSLFLDEDGTTLSLAVQSNQYTAVPIQAPITWESNTWHFVSLNYTLASLQLYLDGQLAASTTNGLPFWPNDGVLATNGIFIGSDSSGANLANADFAYIRTYNYAIMDDLIASQYNRVFTNYLQEGMNMFAGIGFQFWETAMESGTNGLSLSIALEDTNTILTVSGGESGLLYDLYYATNLLGSNATESAWTWLSSVSSGQSYLLYNQPSPIYYMLGTPLDSDSDGLPDAFEILVSHSSTNNADSDTDGLPDGWEWRNFGSFAQTASGDYDQDGVSNLQEYQHGWEPNDIVFNVRMGNQHFNVTNPVGTCSATRGVPSYWTVHVGDLNTNSHSWNPYNGEFTIPLGPTNGAYTVWIGLKGRTPTSSISWVGTKVYLDQTAPTVVITNPISDTTQRPLIQIQGYATERLSWVRYSISNAAGVQTNQKGFLTGVQSLMGGLLTNNFQCFDVPLTNGNNRIVVTAADLAGNQTSTTLNYQLNFSTATNPAIEVTWPPADVPVASSMICVRGQVDDETATVTLSGGGISPIQAIVERNGAFWLQNVSLKSTTNIFRLTASNAAGLVTESNVTIVKSSVRITVTPPVSYQLTQDTITVYGTISDPSYQVQVNGINASLNGTNWTAQNVAVNDGGTALFTVLAGMSLQESFLDDEITTLMGFSADASSDPSLITDSLDLDKPAQIKIVAGEWYSHDKEIDWNGGCFQFENHWQWFGSNGGNSTISYGNGCPDAAWGFEGTHYWLNADGSKGAETWMSERQSWPDGPIVSTTNSVPAPQNMTPCFFPAWVCSSQMAIGFLYEAMHYSEAVNYNVTQSANATVILKTGGRSGSRTKNLFKIIASANEITGPYDWWYNEFGQKIPMDPGTLAIAGSASSFSTNGVLYDVYPDNADIDVTVLSGAPYYEFSVEATKHKLSINCLTDEIVTNGGILTMIGERHTLSASLEPPIGTTGICNWTIPGNTVSNYVADAQNAYIVPTGPLTNVTNVSFCWVEGITNKVIADLGIGGAHLSADKLFYVTAPQIDWMGEIRSPVEVNSNYPPFPGQVSLHFGRGDIVHDGIYIYATNIDLAGYDGWIWIQPIQVGISESHYNHTNGTQIINTASGYDGDTYPYKKSMWGNGVDPYTPDFADSPGGNLSAEMLKRSRSNVLSTYLMVQPDNLGAIPVPLKVTTWSWCGIATNTQSGWCLLSGTAQITATNMSVVSFPIWTNNIAVRVYTTNSTWF